MLKDIGIIKRANKSSNAFDEYCWEYYNNECMPSEYVELCWDAYRNCPFSGNNSLNGNIFELIISSLLVKENIKPMYLQASVAFVPNVIYDIILYSSENYPISLSLKTSLRERYKQADLEAVALKYVHRKAECYLLSLDEHEVQDVKNKISTGDILGIDNVICATTNEFDDFINNLKSKSFIKPEKIEIVAAKHIVE
ncbi:MAG: hypothetical protein LUH07_00210 [Lachnospiraceae bacterium]|nr:hypothetical protein [Lachnospiraceae bacterium]